MEKNFKIGLILSGGGARGFAHLGVIKALNENGIFPDLVSGTSAGAIVGSLYADGYSPDEILKIMNPGNRLQYFSPVVPKGGLMQISGLEKILRENLRAKSFSDLKIPLFVCATDLNNGKAVYFSEGELIMPVLASASIPVLFRPIVIDKVQYVDGGVLDNMPIKPVEQICGFFIGSFVNPTGYEENITSLIHIAERTFMLSMAKELNEKSKKFGLFIAPPELKNYKILDSEKALEVFMVGYNATLDKLAGFDIRSLIG
jgi:NTE family protein